MTKSRREFMTTVATAAATPVIPAFLHGCGSDGLLVPEDASTACSSISPQIALNHGHTITVTLSDVVRGRPKTFLVTSNGEHSHSVSFSAQDLRAIREGGAAMVESSVSALHSHAITITCVISDAGTDSGPSSDSGSASDSGMDSSSDSSVSCASVNNTIAGNHGHVLDAVTQSDVTSGTMKSYGLSEALGHTHMITLSSSNFAALMQGSTVQVTTTLGNGHTHLVTLMCV